jgi:hypothetical protein
MIAIKEGNYTAFSEILGTTDLGFANTEGLNCLDFALAEGRETMAIKLVNAGIKSDWKKVLNSAKKDDMNELIKLIKTTKRFGGSRRLRKKGRKFNTMKHRS